MSYGSPYPSGGGGSGSITETDPVATSALADYLPLAGGTLLGDLSIGESRIVIPGDGGQDGYIQKGTFGTYGGISLLCMVGYELNWQAGMLTLQSGSQGIDFNGTNLRNVNQISGVSSDFNIYFDNQGGHLDGDGTDTLRWTYYDVFLNNHRLDMSDNNEGNYFQYNVSTNKLEYHGNFQLIGSFVQELVNLSMGDGGVPVDASEGNSFIIEIDTDFTLYPPQNGFNGQTILIWIVNSHASNSIVVTLDTGITNLSAGTGSLGALKRGFIELRYDEDVETWYVTNFDSES